MTEKNWSKILKEYSSDEETDNGLTISSIRKNGPKLIELAAQLMKNVPKSLEEPHKKALNVGKGVLPNETIKEFNDIAKHVCIQQSTSK